MRPESGENQNSDEAAIARKTNVAATSEDFPGELTAPRWSVVSFDRCLAGNLTYDKAVKKIKRLQAKKVAGLCIITDEAAARISNKLSEIKR